MYLPIEHKKIIGFKYQIFARDTSNRKKKWVSILHIKTKGESSNILKYLKANNINKEFKSMKIL